MNDMKECRLSTDSWHYRLYRATYHRDHHQTKNLCPYFWMTVIALLSLPATFVGYWPSFSHDSHAGYGCKLLVGFSLWCLIFISTVIGNNFVVVFNLGHTMLAYVVPFVGVALLAAVITAGISLMAITFYLADLLLKPPRLDLEHLPNGLISNMIRAKYHKICPRIIWVDKDRPYRSKEHLE